MDEEVPPALEFDNQILAATAEGADALALQLGRDDRGRLGSREPGVGYLDVLEPTAHEGRLETAADRFDFG
jgi:hypothetical protein